MSTAWDPTSDQRTAHRGTVARGRVTPACHDRDQGTFPSYGARIRGVGPVGAALAGAVLLVLVLALVTYLAWP